MIHVRKRSILGSARIASGVLKWRASSASEKRAWISLWQMWWIRMVGPPLPPFSFGIRWCRLCGTSGGMGRRQMGQSGSMGG